MSIGAGVPRINLNTGNYRFSHETGNYYRFAVRARRRLYRFLLYLLVYVYRFATINESNASIYSSFYAAVWRVCCVQLVGYLWQNALRAFALPR